VSADISAEVRLAQTEADRNAVFAVRYQVFVDEQSVPEELEYDELDLSADHFLALLDGILDPQYLAVVKNRMKIGAHAPHLLTIEEGIGPLFHFLEVPGITIE